MTDTWVDILIDESFEKTQEMDDYALHRAMVLAGYRAGLEEAHGQWVAIRRKQSAADACQEYGRWLDAKLKEQS